MTSQSSNNTSQDLLAAFSQRWRRHPSVPGRHSRSRSRRPAAAPGERTASRKGNRRRLQPGRAAQDHRAGPRPTGATSYDWRKVEARLNSYPQFITEIDGLDIHFIHVRSRHENALPVIVTHGWPGSIVEQLKIIDPLTNPTAHGGKRRGRLPRRHPVDARLRLLGQADVDRLGSGAHRKRLDHADAAPGLQEVRRAGRRLGLRSSPT